MSEPEANEQGSSLIGKRSRFCETQGIVVAVRSKSQGIAVMRELQN